MATADIDMPVTVFANPYLQCTNCGRRAVGMVGVSTALTVLGLLTITLPNGGNGANWPCYHVAARTSICDSWTSTNGCPHPMQDRAQHSNSFTFEGMRK